MVIRLSCSLRRGELEDLFPPHAHPWAFGEGDQPFLQGGAVPFQPSVGDELLSILENIIKTVDEALTYAYDGLHVVSKTLV